MKVTREEGFTPITIVLETKEEADIMWIHLQRDMDKDGNIKGYNIELVNKVGGMLWDMLDKVHTL